jgi:hypothetical protein
MIGIIIIISPKIPPTIPIIVSKAGLIVFCNKL